MVKLDRYIGIHVFLAILTVLGIIVGLALLFAFIDELGDVQGNYGLGDALQYVLLTSPRRLYDMLPMAALIGCLIGLGTLASSSELTIMRAAGVSLGRIVLSVMKPMLVLLVAGILIGEYVAPLTEDIAQARRSLAQGRVRRKAASAACGIVRKTSSCTSTRCSPAVCWWGSRVTASTRSVACCPPASRVAPAIRAITGGSRTLPPPIFVVITPKSRARPRSVGTSS
ncbi:hypothetical protein AB691_3313 [Stutzerimonas stutzeri]|nr:hypothetical protein AB691_3313 [Stutzerimonas stutzeri]